MSVNFLEYYSLRAAVSSDWKQKVHLRTIIFTETPSSVFFTINGRKKRTLNILTVQNFSGAL